MLGRLRFFADAAASSGIKPFIELYFWQPNPNTSLRLLKKPLIAQMIGGYAGHISMEVNFSNGNKKYISIWPDKEVEDGEHSYTPIVSANDLATDIKSEGKIEPARRIIDIPHASEPRLLESVQRLEDELRKADHERESWTVTNNCATYICTDSL